MRRVGLVGLIKIEFPTTTLRLCDGGFFYFDSERYTSEDATFGTLQSVESMTDGMGDSLPGLKMVLLPPDGAALADLLSPAFQNSRVRMWIAEYDVDTGATVTTPDVTYDGIVDFATLILGRGTRAVELNLISQLERLLLRQEDNAMNPSFHKSIWAGEKGNDNAIGLEIAVPWGVESQGSRGLASGGGGRGSFDVRPRYDLQ